VPWQAEHDAAKLLICTLFGICTSYAAVTKSAAHTIIGLKSPMIVADTNIFFKQYSLKYCRQLHAHLQTKTDVLRKNLFNIIITVFITGTFLPYSRHH
jgi:hypothetical protein